MEKELNPLAMMMTPTTVCTAAEFSSELTEDHLDKLALKTDDEIYAAIAAVNPDFDMDNELVAEAINHEACRAADLIVAHILCR